MENLEAGAGLPSAEDLDQVAAEQAATESTAAAAPESADLPAQANLLETNSFLQDRLAKANRVFNSHLATATDKIDSVGKPKDAAPIGGRGFNAPRDAKPAPSDKEKRSAQPKVTVTDAVDNAGNQKESAVHGIRGNHTVRDTYRT